MSKIVTVMGSINYDIVASAVKLPAKGETVAGSSVEMFVGGKGANQAVQASLLGAKTYFIGCAGADVQGETVSKGLEANGVDIRHLTIEPALRTGCASIFVDENGDNMLVHMPGANHSITAAMLDGAIETISNADVFITQNEVNPDAVEYALKLAKAAGVTTILNPAPAVPLKKEIYKLVDYIIPNETECEVYTGISRESMGIEKWKRACAELFISWGVKHVIITLGAKGSYYMGEDGCSIDVPAFKITPVDTTAAGDSFIGGCAYGIISRLPIEKCLLLGNACGGLSATQLGAQSSIQPYERVMEFINGQGMSII